MKRIYGKIVELTSEAEYVARILPPVILRHDWFNNGEALFKDYQTALIAAIMEKKKELEIEFEAI